MTTYHSIKSAKEALKTMPAKEGCALWKCICIAERLLASGLDFFYDKDYEEGRTGMFAVQTLFAKMDCSPHHIHNRLVSLELMVDCLSPIVRVKIDDSNNVTVWSCCELTSIKIHLGTRTGIDLDDVAEIYCEIIYR